MQVGLHRRQPCLAVRQLWRVVGAIDHRQAPVCHLGRQVRGLVDERVVLLSHDHGGGAGNGGEHRPQRGDAVGDVGQQRGAERLHGVGVHAGEDDVLLSLPVDRRRLFDQLVLGAAETHGGRHALRRVEGRDPLVHHLADALVGRHEGPRAGVHEDQRAHEFGPAEHQAERDAPTHGVPQQVDRAAAHLLDEGREVGHELVDGVPVQGSRPGRVAVAPLVQRHHPPTRSSARQVVDDQREVVRRPGEAVAEHEGGRRLGSASSLGPREVDAIDVEGLGHGPFV